MTDQTDAPNEVKIHVTIDREQVSEAARLAAELFITEYASRLVEAVDPNYLDDEPVEDCGCPPRVHVNPERTDWLDEPIPVPRPEPVDITEEPPVGSQLVDRDGDVWERFSHGWEWRMSTFVGHKWSELGDMSWSDMRETELAPLRPATDADRERVGLPVEPAPGMTRCDTCGTERPLNAICPGCEPAPADVDPDEAHEQQEHGRAAFGYCSERRARKDAEAEIYRLADLLAEDKAALLAARADLARMTDARDRHSRAADKWCNLYADKCEEIESVQAKADRYDALRADVWVESGSRVAAAAAAAHGILARDDARAEGQP